MLTNLYIENIAVIEKTSIDFGKGLNVLTGETGAGKSIIIDSINAILGSRASKDLIRNGCDTAFVSAEFSEPCEKALQTLREYGFDAEDDVVLLQREFSTSGKGKCRINGRPATAAVLRAVGVYLINIHGQHESYELMSPELHINYIDKLGRLSGDIAGYQAAYKKYRSLKSELDKAKYDEAERERRVDLLSYQVNELEQAGLYEGEYEELIEQRILIENKEKIASALSEVKEFLNGGDETDGAIQSLEGACDSISSITNVYQDAESVAERLQNAVYELEDCYNEVAAMSDDADNDVGDLEEIEDRIDLINKLGRKYGSTIGEMLEFLENARKELEYLERYEENREALAQDCKKAYNEALSLANALSDKRREVAGQFAAQVKEEMSYLDMPNVELVVKQDKCELNPMGCDSIEILISANPGEAPKPVAKIASGGELSRMMLAIKNVLADTDDIDTLIFDEVDTGISGSASQKVGLKLKEVSRSRQVLCVTHQAQIAALASSHLKIAKTVNNGKTYTSVTQLDHEGRRNELARIIGGVEMTKATLDYAEELLSQGEE
ncbi:MAG: DNA repair protein RecN [Clostridia bacterium]|nr:DNA repair protein RecN [Clostridia bacterium]